MKIKVNNFIICTENHGGYRSGFCVLCQNHGWLEDLEHKKKCLIKTGVEFLEVTSVGEENEK